MLTNIPTWTTDRVELLKNHFEAGLTCREIAASIGVSRNAVIGKLARLQLTRGPAQGRTAPDQGPPGSAPGNPFRACSIRSCRPSMKTRQPLQEEPIASERRCSLLELSNETVPLADQHTRRRGFLLCGNTPVEGMPYCSGHHRLAYRPGSRQRVARCLTVYERSTNPRGYALRHKTRRRF